MPKRSAGMLRLDLPRACLHRGHEMSGRTLLTILGIVVFTILVPRLLRRRGRSKGAGPAVFPFESGRWLPCGDRLGSDAGFPSVRSAPGYRPLPGDKKIRQAAGNQEKLQQHGLPPLATTGDLLRWLGIDLRAFLALANPGNRLRPRKTNYVEWTVPKKRGGARVVCTPK